MLRCLGWRLHSYFIIGTFDWTRIELVNISSNKSSGWRLKNSVRDNLTPLVDSTEVKVKIDGSVCLVALVLELVVTALIEAKT